MTDEFVEQKTRVYLPKKKKDGGKFERFLVNPMMRMAGIKPKNQTAKERRVTA